MFTIFIIMNRNTKIGLGVGATIIGGIGAYYGYNYLKNATELLTIPQQIISGLVSIPRQFINVIQSIPKQIIGGINTISIPAIPVPKSIQLPELPKITVPEPPPLPKPPEIPKLPPLPFNITRFKIIGD